MPQKLQSSCSFPSLARATGLLFYSDFTGSATPVSGGFQGQATDIEIQARETIAIKRRLEEIIAEHAKQPIEKVSKDMERDYFMSADEAQQYSLIDRVISKH